MSDWHDDLEATRAHVWAELENTLTARQAPWRTPVLSTLGTDGAPEARTVVLRAVDPEAGTVTVYTDLRSAKVAEIGREPRAALTFWDPAESLQLRLRGTAVILSGADADPIWRALPPHATADYGTVPAPGSEIPEPAQRATTGSISGFAVLVVQAVSLETLHIGRDRHRRARFQKGDRWGGVWLAP